MAVCPCSSIPAGRVGPIPPVGFDWVLVMVSPFLPDWWGSRHPSAACRLSSHLAQQSLSASSGCPAQRPLPPDHRGAVGAVTPRPDLPERSEEHTFELQSRVDLVCRL